MERHKVTEGLLQLKDSRRILYSDHVTLQRPHWLRRFGPHVHWTDCVLLDSAETLTLGVMVSGGGASVAIRSRGWRPCEWDLLLLFNRSVGTDSLRPHGL